MSLDGRSWLGLGFALLLLSILSTFVVFAAGFDFDPNDLPGSYYRDEIPWRVAALLIGITAPALSAVAAGLSIWAIPRGFWRVLAAVVILVLAGAVIVFCWQVGVSGVERAHRFAEEFPG